MENGGIKHQVILSTETSFLLNSLINSSHIDNTVLAQNEVDKLHNLVDKQRLFPFRYQILNPEECNNTYLIVFNIYECRDITVVLFIEFYKSNQQYT